MVKLHSSSFWRLLHPVTHAMGYINLRPVFCLSTDMTDGIKQWKRHALSIQNDLVMKKNEVNRTCSFCCIACARSLLRAEGWMARQMMSNTIVANWLLAAEVTNKSYKTSDALGEAFRVKFCQGCPFWGANFQEKIKSMENSRNVKFTCFKFKLEHDQIIGEWNLI